MFATDLKSKIKLNIQLAQIGKVEAKSSTFYTVFNVRKEFYKYSSFDFFFQNSLLTPVDSVLAVIGGNSVVAVKHCK